MPMPLPKSLNDREKMVLPPGTFVPSAKLASNGLLEVRKAIFGPNGDLYVADRAADCVRIYEAPTGHFLRNLVSRSDQLDKPIHLLLSPDGRYLFIGSGGKNLIFGPDFFSNSTTRFLSSKTPRFNCPARMAF